MIRLLIMLLGGVMIGRFLADRRRKPDNPDPESLITHPTVDAEARRQDNGDITISWQDDLGAVEIYAGTRPDNVDRDNPIAQTTGDTQTVTVGALNPHIRHFFEIAGDDQRLTIAERILPLEGVANFRDIGGYVTDSGKRVRWGRVYRAGAFANPTDADIEHLNSIGLKLICDLRTPEEVEETPDVVPDGAIYKHTPVDTDDNVARRRRRALSIMLRPGKLTDVMREMYIDVMIEKNADLIGAILRDIANPDNLPLVYHCAAGKDRTGIISALLLTLLGVPEATIIADYTLSNRYYDVFSTYAERNIRHFKVFGISADDLYPLLIADATLLQQTLDHIREKYGSIHAYLTDVAGLDDAIIADLKANLLE